MKYRYPALLALVLPLFTQNLAAQCGAGEVAVSITIQTDAYGYETYWQLLPSGNPCGTGTIAFGGSNVVGCNGAGARVQNTSAGYANNTTYTVGPWCLTEGGVYDLFWADDWGDGGGTFTILVNGQAIASHTGSGATARWSFTAVEPEPYDAAVLKVGTFGKPTGEPMVISAMVRNEGSATINTLQLTYTINGGSPIQAQAVGLSIAPFTSALVEHPTDWSSWTAGYYNVVVTSGDINGNADGDASDNSANKLVSVWEPAPNLIDWYVGATPNFTTIANSGDGINIPRDLDFYPDLNKKQLWVANKDTEASGSSTVTLYNAGTSNQEALWRRDGNAWHFMSLTTGLAFGETELFATSPGVFDANHNGAPPFTGPALWTSDTLVYTQPSGGNGSHLDMLHTSPHSQGIAHEVDNVFWVVDGYNNDVVRYDFQEDHGPGADDHSDARIRRFAGMNITRDPADHIVSHCDLHKESGWLYVVNHGQDKVFRMNINSGTLGGVPSFGPFEDYAEYRYVVGFTMEDVVTTGLVEPAGIVVKDDRMLITDHATGDIIIYNISAMPATEMGRIATGVPGIMGVTIAPDGSIWYVNATTETVMQVTIGTVGVDELSKADELRIAPNPANAQVQLTFKAASGTSVVEVLDAAGRLVRTEAMSGPQHVIQVGTLPAGTYTVQLTNTDGGRTQGRMVVAH